MASKNVETSMAAHRAFNNRDFDAVVKTMAADIVYQDIPRGTTFRGRNEFKEFMAGWTKALSNAEVFEPTYLEAGDTVIAQFTGRGRNDGPMGSFAPKGKQMSVQFCEIFQFDKQGLMVSGWVYYDQLSMLIQLGHIQPLK